MKHPSKHRRRSKEEIRTLLSIQAKSNVPIIAFCKAHKLNKATYYNWRNRYGMQSEATAQFIPIQFRESQSVPALFGEIELSSKVLVRLYQQVDAAWIKSLLS